MQAHRRALENASRLMNSLEMQNNILFMSLLCYVNPHRHVYRFRLEFDNWDQKITNLLRGLENYFVSYGPVVRTLDISISEVRNPFQGLQELFLGGRGHY